MMKLVSCLGLVGAAAAASSDIAPGFFKSTHRIRILQEEEDDHEDKDGEADDNNNGGGGNFGDLSAYSLKYNTCVHTKIASNDDSVEGNSYYVNGAYRGQYNSYATFHLCQDNNGSGQCTCDTSIEYAAPLADFVQISLQYNGGGGDEANYLGCQQYGQENGIDYYLGPQCSDNGDIMIGTYYDEDCTVKASYSTPSFNYNSFKTIETNCQACASGGCATILQESRPCANGKDLSGQNDQGVCMSVKRATAEVDYSKVKKRNAGAILFAKVFFVMLGLGLIVGFMFLSYTYYIRHRGDRSEQLVGDVPAGAALT
jgi:hypothetical protein